MHNILCVIDNLGPGGAQRQIIELAIGFKERGNSVEFLTYHNLSFFMPILDQSGIKVYCVENSNYLKRLLKLRKFIRTRNYNAIVSFLEGANIMCEFAGLPTRRWKLIVGERSANYMILNSFKLRFYRLFHIFSDYIVANSYSNIKIVLKANPFLLKSKCKVIYNAIDFNRWRRVDKNRITDNNYNNKLKIVVTASHIYLKNLKGLVTALSLLNQYELDKIQVEWYGDKIFEPFYDNSLPEAKSDLERFQISGVISFYQATNDIVEKIQDANVVGLFSFIEGLPNSICEGMACAKPVICSNISDISEFLSYDRNLLFDPYDPVSIMATLRYIINLNKSQLNEIGLMNEKISREKFNRNKIVSEYLKLMS